MALGMYFGFVLNRFFKDAHAMHTRYEFGYFTMKMHYLWKKAFFHDIFDEHHLENI